MSASVGGIGQQRAQGGGQEVGGVVQADIACGQHAAYDFRHAQPLGDGESRYGRSRCATPSAAVRLLCDGQDRAAGKRRIEHACSLTGGDEKQAFFFQKRSKRLYH